MSNLAHASAHPPMSSALPDQTPTGSATTADGGRWGRITFRVLAWSFVAGVAVQVFLAGLGVFVGPTWWSVHTSFIHVIEFLPLLMLAAAFVGKLPARIKWLTLAAVALIGLQYGLIELARTAPTLGALHPVNALLIFWLAITLARWRQPPP